MVKAIWRRKKRKKEVKCINSIFMQLTTSYHLQLLGKVHTHHPKRSLLREQRSSNLLGLLTWPMHCQDDTARSEHSDNTELSYRLYRNAVVKLRALSLKSSCKYNSKKLIRSTKSIYIKVSSISLAKYPVNLLTKPTSPLLRSSCN